MFLPKDYNYILYKTKYLRLLFIEESENSNTKLIKIHKQVPFHTESTNKKNHIFQSFMFLGKSRYGKLYKNQKPYYK